MFHHVDQVYLLRNLVNIEEDANVPRSWVMLPAAGSKQPFVLLPNEKILITSPSRTSLELKTPSNFPGNNPFSANSPAGTAYITNQRVRYSSTLRQPG